MGIGIATSPAWVTSTFSDTAVTATFSPGVDTVLVAHVLVNGSAAPTVTGGSLTWTRRVQNLPTSLYLDIWTAPCVAGATNITATATSAGAGAIAFKVDIVTGALVATPTGSTGTGNSATNNVTVSGYTSSAAGSRGFAVAMDENALGTPTSTDVASAHTQVFTDGMTVRKAADTASAGEAVTFNLDAFGTGTPAWHWAALEIIPAVAPFSPLPPLIVNQAARMRAANW